MIAIKGILLNIFFIKQVYPQTIMWANEVLRIFARNIFCIAFCIS
jgi:hypothetical protein